MMRRAMRPALFFWMLLLAVAWALLLPRISAADGRMHLLIREMGTVEFRPVAATDWNEVISTRFIDSQNVVRTASESKAHLQFFIRQDHVARVALLDNVTLEVSRLALEGNVREVTLSHKGGRIYVDARISSGRRQQFTVQTPSATIAVRGTRFYSDVAEEDGTTMCGCAEGRVAVTGAGVTVMLHPGYFTVVRPGQPPEAPRWDVREFGPPPRGSAFPGVIVEWDPIFVIGRPPRGRHPPGRYPGSADPGGYPGSPPPGRSPGSPFPGRSPGRPFPGRSPGTPSPGRSPDRPSGGFRTPLPSRPTHPQPAPSTAPRGQAPPSRPGPGEVSVPGPTPTVSPRGRSSYPNTGNSTRRRSVPSPSPDVR